MVECHRVGRLCLEFLSLLHTAEKWNSREMNYRNERMDGWKKKEEEEMKMKSCVCGKCEQKMRLSCCHSSLS